MEGLWEEMGEAMARESKDWAGSLKVVLSAGDCGGGGEGCGNGGGCWCFTTKPGSVSEQMRLLDEFERSGGLDGGVGRVGGGEASAGVGLLD